MSPAQATLEAGLDALIAHHGEALLWRPGSSVVLQNSGEAVTDTDGSAVESGTDQETEFQGIFDDEFQIASPEGAGFATTVIAVTCQEESLPSANVNDLIERDGVTYNVTRVEPDGLGRLTLILSKHAH